LKIQDGGGRRLEKSINDHISATVFLIDVKFGTVTDFGRLELSALKISTF